MPCSSICRTGAIPSPRKPLAEGLCTTLTPRSAMMARSLSSTHTQWTMTVRSVRTPSESRKATGLSPVAVLDSLGVLTERTVMVHCVWVDESALAIMADRGVSVVHNPSANGFLGDGIAPVRQMLEHGIPVCLGTDGGCTNSRQSVFEEMRMAALMAKARAADAAALGAGETFLMGTARGGQILGGLPIGRIAPDYAADLVVVDLAALSVQPPQTAANQIVYSMQPDAIRRVIVGGETIVEDGRLTRVDEAEIAAKVREVTVGWEPVARYAVPAGP